MIPFSEEVRYWEGPLSEVSLHTVCMTNEIHVHHVNVSVIATGSFAHSTHRGGLLWKEE